MIEVESGYIDTVEVEHCSIDDKHIDTSTAYRNIVESMGEDKAKETIKLERAKLPDIRFRR